MLDPFAVIRRDEPRVARRGRAILYLLPSLLRRAGAKHAELATLAVVANPFFIVSATSLIDALWAIAFLLGGVEAAQRRRPWLAGTLWALAIGCRMATVLLVVAYLAADAILRRSCRGRPWFPVSSPVFSVVRCSFLRGSRSAARPTSWRTRSVPRRWQVCSVDGC